MRGDPTRVLALSDALFAIVLTLLVLDLRPDAADGLTYPALVALWPRLFAFFLTFLVGGSFWVGHHTDLESLASYDHRFLWLNLRYLLPVSLLPFTTNLIGNNVSPTSWSLYALNVLCIALGQAAVWSYARLAGLLGTLDEPAAHRYALAHHISLPLVFAVSIPVAFVSTMAARLTAILEPIGYRLLPALVHYRPAADPAAARATGWRLLAWMPVLLMALWTLWLTATGQL